MDGGYPLSAIRRPKLAALYAADEPKKSSASGVCGFAIDMIAPGFFFYIIPAR